MIKKIHLGMGLELEVINTEYAKTHTLINNLDRMDTELGFKLNQKEVKNNGN